MYIYLLLFIILLFLVCYNRNFYFFNYEKLEMKNKYEISFTNLVRKILKKYNIKTYCVISLHNYFWDYLFPYAYIFDSEFITGPEMDKHEKKIYEICVNKFIDAPAPPEPLTPLGGWNVTSYRDGNA